METPKINDKLKFASLFEHHYLGRGFGSMNKAELEALFFFLLKQSDSFKGKTNFEISLELQIPEAKVRRLAYESELRYGNHEYADKELIEVLISSHIDTSDKKKIQFAIEDKYVQSFLSARLKSINHFADTSFNPEIVTLSASAFADLLGEFYDEKAKELFEKEIASHDKKSFSTIISSALAAGANMVTVLEFVNKGIEGVKEFASYLMSLM